MNIYISSYKFPNKREIERSTLLPLSDHFHPHVSKKDRNLDDNSTTRTNWSFKKDRTKIRDLQTYRIRICGRREYSSRTTDVLILSERLLEKSNMSKMSRFPT